MPSYPNTAVVQSLAPFFGSCKVEVSLDDGSNFTNLGLARAIIFNENQEVTNIQADNGPDLKNYLSQHTVDMSFNLLEFYLPTLNKIRGGIDTLSTTTGGVKTTDTDVFSTGDTDFAYNQPIYFVNQGDSTTLPAIIKVQGVDTNNSSDTLDTGDYTTFTDANNKSGIIVYTGGGFNDTESLRITYEYETIVARKISSGGFTDISPRYYRFTNLEYVNGVAKYRYLVVYSASITQGLQLAFKSSNEADPVLEIPIALTAKIDATRSAGDQLYYIEDQKATA